MCRSRCRQPGGRVPSLGLLSALLGLLCGLARWEHVSSRCSYILLDNRKHPGKSSAGNGASVPCSYAGTALGGWGWNAEPGPSRHPRPDCRVIAELRRHSASSSHCPSQEGGAASPAAQACSRISAKGLWECHRGQMTGCVSSGDVPLGSLDTESTGAPGRRAPRN